MAEADLENVATEPRELMLDPFAYQPGFASRIPGLGGNAPGHDPTYVFHTPYVEAAPGPAHFTIQFSGLKARRGTLVLRVHMLRMEEGARAMMANSDRILLNRLVQHGGRMAIRFEGFRDVSFALFATIPDDTDVQADGLTVTLDRPADPHEQDDVIVEAANTAYGSSTVRPAVRMLAAARTTLGDPASQVATVRQTREPTFAEWRERLGATGDAVDQWDAAYVMQALRRYGMLQDGARGVGFGVGEGPLPAAIAALGASVLATDLPPKAPVEAEGGEQGRLAALRRPGLCDDATFQRSVGFRTIGVAPIPREIVNFDFAWSTGVGQRLPSVAAGLRFAEDAMACLRPGGIAVHMFAFTAAQANPDGLTLYRRGDMERLALTLISRGHEVAQIRLSDDEMLAREARGRGAALSSFGLIARKAVSPF